MIRGPWTLRRLLLVAAFGLAGLLLVAAIVWREDILRTGLDPKVPFQTYVPPPAPDYTQRTAWALLPAEGTAPHPGAPADVFFLHPTTYDGGRHWNGPIDDPEANARLRGVMLPNYAGPFVRVGRIYAPRYRQGSLYTQLTLRDDAREARVFAYGDARRALDHFLRTHDSGRPLILAGVGQGGFLMARLAAEAVTEQPELARRIVAVYLIDTVVPAAAYSAGAALPACDRRDEAGCVVAWAQVPEHDDEAARQRLQRALVWTPRGRLTELGTQRALCVNPLLGARTETEAPARLNLGAANATDLEWGARPAFLSRQVSAVCREGLLRHSEPRSPSLRPSGSWADRRRSPPYNLFYADIEADAEARLAAWRLTAGS